MHFCQKSKIKTTSKPGAKINTDINSTNLILAIN